MERNRSLTSHVCLLLPDQGIPPDWSDCLSGERVYTSTQLVPRAARWGRPGGPEMGRVMARIKITNNTDRNNAIEHRIQDEIGPRGVRL